MTKRDKRMFGKLNFVKIVVEETDTRIIMSGFRTWTFFKELKKVFGSRIENGMPYVLTMNRIEIPKFFAYDFMEILKAFHDKGEHILFSKSKVAELIKKLNKLPIFVRAEKKFPSRLDRSRLGLFKLKPLPKQEDFFVAFDQKTQRYGLNGYILAAAPGTGKTLASLYLTEMRKSKVTIIFSPNNAMENVWGKTLKNEFKNPPEYFKYGEHSVPTGRERYFIFSHENLSFAKGIIFRYIKPENVDIVVDECHAFNDLRSDRTQLLIEICKYINSTMVLFMSGTPFKALGAEILPWLNCADPLYTQNTQERFKKVFGSNGNTALSILAARIGRSSFTVEKKEVVNNKRYEIELRVTIPHGEEFTLEVLKAKMQAFVKERVGYYQKEMPRFELEYKECLKYFELTLRSAQDRAKFADYNKKVQRIRKAVSIRDVLQIIREVNVYERKVIIPALMSNHKQIFREATSVYKYVDLKIQGEALGRILGRERERCNVDIFKNLDNAKAYCEDLELNGESFGIQDIFDSSESKCIFFTDYVAVVKESGTTFTGMGMNPKLVYGDTNKDLTNILKEVEKDPTANPIVATYKSLSTAVPLIMLDTAVFLNVPFRSYIMEQAESRLDRIGQKNELKFYNVYLDTGGKPNISTRSGDILKWSKEMVEILMGRKIDADLDVEETEAEMEKQILKVESKKYESKLVW